MTMPRETLAAYADGQLEGEAARAVEAQIAADSGLQAQLAAHRALKARLATHFAPVAELPIPEHLIETIRNGAAEDNVVDLAEASRKRAQPVRPLFRWAGPALAASLVLALVGYQASQPPVDSYARGEVAIALDGQLSAVQTSGGRVRILLSFRDTQGRYCRGFSSTEQAGIACRDGRGWKLDAVTQGGKAATSEYRQAGSAAAEVMAAIQERAVGPALDRDEERKAIAAGWQNN